MAENSRRNMNLTAHAIGDDKRMFDALMKIMFEEPDPYNRRAAWAITAVTDAHPHLLEPYIGTLISYLQKSELPEGIFRCLLRQLPLIKIPEEHMGVLFDLCMTWSENPKYALAIRANAMTVLYQISNSHPELKKELIVLFELIHEEESPAMISRSKLLLKKLKAETKK